MLCNLGISKKYSKSSEIRMWTIEIFQHPWRIKESAKRNILNQVKTPDGDGKFLRSWTFDVVAVWKIIIIIFLWNFNCIKYLYSTFKITNSPQTSSLKLFELFQQLEFLEMSWLFLISIDSVSIWNVIHEMYYCLLS